MSRRLLFVDDEPAIRITMKAVLANHGYEVSTAATVAEALQKITSEKFDVLLSDLNIGHPADGLTVVSAMRRTQPDAVTMILTGYPAFETALEAIRQQVDDYIVKPAHIPTLVQTIESKLAAGPGQRQLSPPKRVAMILQENLEHIEDLWLSYATSNPALSSLPLTREQRREFLRRVLRKVIQAAQSYSGENSECANPAEMRNDVHELDGYSAVALLAEFCLLRRAIAQVVQTNLLAVNLSFLVPDLAAVNESLDEQAQSAMNALADQIKS